MVGILVFSIGLLALAGSMTFSLKGLATSGEHIELRQALFNKVDSYLLRRTVEHNNSAAGAGALPVQTERLTISGDIVTLNFYRFEQPENRDYSLYITEGAD